MTTSGGAPVGDNQNSLTVGPRGPVLMKDLLLIEKMAHFNRERIPERVVHAKRSGAHGVFEVAQDDFLPINKAKCPVHTYHRDGHIRFDENGGREPNYEPNSFSGPEEDPHFRDFS